MLSAEHGADRRIASAEALGDTDDIGRHALLLAGEERAGAPHTAHHLVEDEQHTMAVADLADAAEVARRGRGAAQRSPCDRLCDKGHHLAWPGGEDHGLQLVGGATAV